MKAIIIEDEKPAAGKLLKALQKCTEPVEVTAVLRSAGEAISWIRQNGLPELIFMDIELSDGPSFKIFEEIQIECPVIFTTAYDEYWQAAFEHNSIDYLLKPIRQDKLELALKKYNRLKQHFMANYQNLANWQQQIPANGYKKRFLVKRGAEFVSVKTDEIAYFYAAHKLVCMVHKKTTKFVLDQSLADIEKQVDTREFFRVNRKYLVNVAAIKKIRSFPKSKLQLEIEPAIQEEIIISQENVASFKEWMGQ